MISRGTVRSDLIAPAYARSSGVSGFARKMVEQVSEITGAVHNLVLDVRDSYRPELHYMRGRGPKWRAKQPPFDGMP